MSVRVEIVVIGNEVLEGDVLDTNGHWLCQQLSGLGARVARITTVPDVDDDIAVALADALERGARLVITSGGLGPTDDDLTLRAVARALGRDLVTEPRALDYVARRYADLAQIGAVPDARMTPAWAKMAAMPAGAEPLWNSVGTAPGSLVHVGDCIIVSLPGVPGELRSIFRESLSPTLLALLGSAAYGRRMLHVECADESLLAPILREVIERHPDVYIKSRARAFQRGQRFRVTLSARADASEHVDALLASAANDLVRTLGREGLATEPTETDERAR